jgi:hypothetical protein
MQDKTTHQLFLICQLSRKQEVPCLQLDKNFPQNSMQLESWPEGQFEDSKTMCILQVKNVLPLFFSS